MIETTIEQPQQYLLPPLGAYHQNMKTIVLDLDETLVHSQIEESEEATYVLNIDFSSEIKNIYVIERPGVNEFLRTMAEYYELVLFTSGLQAYAEKVIEKLDPNKQLFSHCLFRQHCIQMDTYYIKDLTKLGRELNNVIIIDNSAECFCLQPDNGFLIPSFFDDLQDYELIENIEFFIQLSELEDVRQVEYWKEQFDAIIINSNNDLLNEIVEDSQETFLSPIQSQNYHQNSQDNQQYCVDETKQIINEKDFINQYQTFSKKIASNNTIIIQNKLKRLKKQCKTTINLNQNINLNNSFNNLRLKEIQQSKAFKSKSYCEIIEASTQRITKKMKSKQNLKVDDLRFQNNENNCMSPLAKNQEYYSKSSKIQFI